MQKIPPRAHPKSGRDVGEPALRLHARRYDLPSLGAPGAQRRRLRGRLDAALLPDQSAQPDKFGFYRRWTDHALSLQSAPAAR